MRTISRLGKLYAMGLVASYLAIPLLECVLGEGGGVGLPRIYVFQAILVLYLSLVQAILVLCAFQSPCWLG